MRTTIACLLGLSLTATAAAVEFEDYDFSRWSQEVTECDRQAAHGRDPGHVADPVTQDGMDKEAAMVKEGVVAVAYAVQNYSSNKRVMDNARGFYNLVFAHLA